MTADARFDDDITLVADSDCELGESPVWHADERAVYWLDLPDGRVLRYDPTGQSFETVCRAGPLGGLAILRDGSLLLCATNGRLATLRAGRVETLPTRAGEQRHCRFNDCLADPRGRLYSGTIVFRLPASGPVTRATRRLLRRLRVPEPKGHGRLIRFDPDGAIDVVARDLGRPNGMGFSPELDTIYVTDSAARTIFAYDYDEPSGRIDNRRVFARLTDDSDATPDGLAVDESGNVWSAHHRGGRIIRYRPDGSVDRQIEVPTSRVTSLAFGGEDLRDLYITTAGGDRRDRFGPLAGALFRLPVDVAGIPEYRAHLPRPVTAS